MAASSDGTHGYVIPESGIRPFASKSGKLPTEGDSMGHAGRQPEHGSEDDAIPNAENYAIRNASRQSPERSVLPAQKVICEVQRSEHVQRASDNADDCERVSVDHHLSMSIIKLIPIDWPLSSLNEKIRVRISCQRLSGYIVGMVPPSITCSVPVIDAARGEARKATSSATSLG